MRNGLKRIQNVILIGSSSEIGLTIVRKLPLAADARLVLVGRRRPDVEALYVDYSQVDFVGLDLLAEFDANLVVDSLFSGADIDVVIFAAGVLGSQADLEVDPRVNALYVVNAVSQIRLLSAIAQRMKAQRHGRMLVISSVAAMRPRLSNYFYGSSKAALDFFARGLREELKKFGVSVSILRPGFVRTKMTAGAEAAPFASDVATVGRLGSQGLFADKAVIYAPGILKYVMSILCKLPNSILNKLE